MNIPTLDTLKAAVIAAGHKVSAGSYETPYMVYACSVKTVPGTYGHPRFEAHYNKDTGWLSIDGQQPVKLA